LTPITGHKGNPAGRTGPAQREENRGMFEQVMDTFRKATESTVQMQQQMLRQWTQQWPQMPGIPTIGFGAPWLEQFQAFQKQVASSVTDLLKKHRETLDSQYSAGIRTIEEAFRVGEAKDPAQLKHLTEELWKQSIECLKTTSESQMKEFQLVVEKWIETVSKGAAAAKV
jgi:hypothetical protein